VRVPEKEKYKSKSEDQLYEVLRRKRRSEEKIPPQEGEVICCKPFEKMPFPSFIKRQMEHPSPEGREGRLEEQGKGTKLVAKKERNVKLIKINMWKKSSQGTEGGHGRYTAQS